MGTDVVMGSEYFDKECTGDGEGEVERKKIKKN